MFTVMAATIFTATRAPAMADASARPATRAPRRSFWSLRGMFRRRLGGVGRG